MGNLGLTAQDAAGYEAHVEGRVLELGRRAGREELNRQWRQIRRGRISRATVEGVEASAGPGQRGVI